MSKQVEFFFDVGSPYSYLAWHALPRVAARHGATVVWRPMLLGGVFKATGNRSPAEVEAKRRWSSGDLKRWARHFGVTFVHNPDFPINTLALMRGAAGYQLRDASKFARYLDLIFRAMWEQPRNLGDAQVLANVLRAGGFDPDEFRALIDDPAVKEALKRNTEEAVERGVFGAPTFFVGDEMFWGQDRLVFVDEALGRIGAA